ncbi:MAG: 1-deoxy-D-xylulose-5-phosphate reductoisomerase [Burkholderiales bacterium]|nr:1-deoxy-D-xylulose-5-phosphate reductoisomerase [Burkholderiales bacterium]
MCYDKGVIIKSIVILGSTGSIGVSTLEVISHNLDKYKVFALVANTNLDKLLEQCIKYIPKYAVILDKVKSMVLKDKLKLHNIATEVFNTENELINLAVHDEVDIVMSAIVGSRGLLPTYRAIKANKRVLLANKESLIAGGKLIIDALKHSRGELIPVDSEHSAVFQCLESNLQSNMNYVNRIILTASGGPFRERDIETLKSVTVEEALKHPNWLMGRKITIDSSTLMNKGLEVIEAYWLFGQDLSKIEVIIHPQSIIHSMVEYIDGSIIAQLGTPNMQTPIAYALSYPERVISGSSKLDFTKLSNLTFYAPDYAKFPCLSLAFVAIKHGGAMPAVLNAANEIAVGAFLERKIGFCDISATISYAMDAFAIKNVDSVEGVIELDNEVRNFVKERIIC